MRTFKWQVIVVGFLGLVPRPAADAQAVRPDSGVGTSRLRTTYEVAGFLVGLSIFDRLAFANDVENGKKVFSSTFRSTWDHLREQKWVRDPDPFNINQFGHPYFGATAFGIGRSTGHSFWKSAAISNVASFTWEMAGETTSPSSNDLITTSQAGSLLGEALYRVADLVLKDNNGKPPWWHAYLATIISPPTAFNRKVLGENFRAHLPDSAPPTAWQLRLGATGDAIAKDAASPATLLQRDVTAEVAIAYGLPGKAGYDYSRPLDYFDVELSLLSSRDNPLESLMLRGLLIGRRTGEAGVWGLYGSYDYISPYLFRVSSVALSLGTTQQHTLAPAITLQGTALGGVGYGAAGTTRGFAATPTAEAQRDYHLGVAPQALLALRLIAADRMMLDLGAREYYVTGVGSDDKHGSELIFRGNIGASVRVVGGHTIGVRYVQSMRDARYGSIANTHISEGTFSVVYSFLGASHFGVVTPGR
jgi:hypothetical protein